MKISKKYSHLLFSVIMAFIMSGIVTLLVSVVNNGLDGVMMKWLKNWGIAFATVVPIIYILAPKIKKLVEKITY